MVQEEQVITEIPEVPEESVEFITVQTIQVIMELFHLLHIPLLCPGYSIHKYALRIMQPGHM